MEDFCGSTFWDETQIWQTSKPDVPLCFERTVLSWIPCAFALITAGIEIHNAFQSKKAAISSTLLNTSKMILTVTLAVLMITELIASVSINDVMRYPVDHVTPGVRAITFCLVGILQILNKRQGVPSSGFLFMFWFSSVVCEVFSFQTQLRSLPIQYDYKFDAVRSIITLCSYPLVVIQFVLHFFSDTNGKIQKDGTDKIGLIEQVSPESTASFPSHMTFQWFWPLAYKGFKKSLEFTDLWGLNPEDKAQNVIQRFNRYWLSVVRNKSCSDQEVSALSSLIKANWTSLVVGILYRLIQDLISFVSPFLLELLITHVGSDEEAWKGYLYATLLFLTGMVQTVLMAQHYHQMSLVGLRARSAIIGAVFEKSLRVSSAGRKGSTLGEIVNLVSVDSQRFVDLAQYINEMWSAPLTIALSLYFLWNTMGAAVLGGLVVMILLVPLNIFIANKNKTLQMRQMKNKDERSKLMNEILSGIKVLKLYAWEPSFEMQIKSIRQKEISILKTSAMLNAFGVFVWSTAPFLVSLVTFGTYVLMDENNVLDARKAFVSLTYFNIMRRPMSVLPVALGFIVTASVSMKRVSKFLNLQEISPNDLTHYKDPNGDIITVKNGQFSWDQAPNLTDINLKIPEGSLVAIVGPVGAGKTSLLSAVLGETKKLSGTVNIDGSIAYVAQQAWIQNATVRDNILFNSPYEAGKYQKIIGACALKPDLKILPGGDRTEIGEKGINLSGGQKQRISLARAVYRDADIYLLDDPLSAVDSHVGKHLFDEVIGPHGILKNKTRVFVTHGMTYLPKVDAIVVMSNGRISQVGTFDELIKQKGPFSEFLKQHAVDEEIEDDLIFEAVQDVVVALTGNQERRSSANRRVSQLEEDKKLERQLSRMSMRGEAPVSNDKLIAAELIETGRVKTEVYKHYLRSVSLKFAIPAVFLFVAMQALVMGSSVWLSEWSSKSVANQTDATRTRDLYLGVYGAFGLAQGLASLFGNALMAIGCLKAAEFLHVNMLQRVLRSPMAFFDTTPLGRVLNRFSKDVDVVDTTLPQSLQYLLLFGLQVLGTLIIISYETPWFSVAIIPTGILYYTAQRFYLATSRQLKRMESQSRSPINSHFSETVAGAMTIRAFGMQRQFIEHSQNTVDNNQVSYYPSIVALRWLTVRLETISNLIVFFAALFAVISDGEESSLGLSVSYALSMTQLLNYLVRMTSEVETNIVAVERIKEYGEVKQEASWDVPENRPQSDWPVRGEIIFENYQTRYREGLDLVLRGVSCVIQPGEKIGIVGRTGAGKSSLTLGLFRIIEAAGGHIEIDGRKLSELGLHDVRGKLTIIPQDPVLFSGSFRMNLDPFGKHKDDALWHALEYAHLKSFVNSLPSGLEYVVTEGGENLSVGQRQLVCLARALLWKTKILILDEATAAVDLQTDDLIQKTIRTEFKECTVLTIAHRLNTIMDSSRVMVLDKGVIKEFASPQELLETKTSIFYGMAKDAGLV